MTIILLNTVTGQLNILLWLFVALLISLIIYRKDRKNRELIRRHGLRVDKKDEPKRKAQFIKDHKVNISKQIIESLKSKGYRFRDEKRGKKFIKNNIHIENNQGKTTVYLRRGGAKLGTNVFLFTAFLERYEQDKRAYYRTVINHDLEAK